MTFSSQIAWWLPPIILLSALLHIQAEYAGARKRVYVLKTLTTSLIILFALLIRPPVDAVYQTLIVAGLVFCLGGDVFLMLPNDRFILGLVSFLIGHLLYIAAFVSLGGFQLDLDVLVLFLLYGIGVVVILWRGMGALRMPVLFYVAVILIMGWQAVAGWRAMATAASLAAAFGAGSFVLSDSVLAIDRFRHRFPAARALVLSSYFFAQTLIALSISS